MKEIVFYGALGSINEQIVGGGEAGNLKTIGVLESNGFIVHRLHKPYPKNGTFRAFLYILSLLKTLLDLFIILSKNKKIQQVHISGFYIHLIYQELFLILISKLFNKKTIYELRGGGVEEVYKSKGKLYRIFFKKAIRTADVILSQGEKYIEFIKSLEANKYIHYPNYVKNELLAFNNLRDGLEETINLVYFGRISESKNVEFIVDICNSLKIRKVKFDLSIIGSGTPEYIQKIINKIEGCNLQSNITISKPLFGNALYKELTTKHFYIFPSQERREGHSNALTEAMALGLVPIASNAGFNAQIINNNKLVVLDFNAEIYASCIVDIWNSNWLHFSQEVSQRIINSYTEKIVSEALLEQYK